MKDCVFCKIVKGELPSIREYEDDKVLVFRNIKLAAEVHLLVIPKKHKKSFMDLTGNEISLMLRASQRLIKDKKILDSYRVVINGGRFQFVPHVHWHLMGGKFKKDFEKMV